MKMFERIAERAARLARIKDPAVREYLTAVDDRLDALAAKQDQLIAQAGFDVDAIQDQPAAEDEG